MQDCYHQQYGERGRGREWGCGHGDPALQPWFKVQGLGFRVKGLGFRVPGLGFGVYEGYSHMKSRLDLRACTQMYPNLLIYSVYTSIYVLHTYIAYVCIYIRTYHIQTQTCT